MLSFSGTHTPLTVVNGLPVHLKYTETNYVVVIYQCKIIHVIEIELSINLLFNQNACGTVLG